VHVAALRVELRFAQSRSLKDKRAIIKPVLDGSRRRFSVAAAEVAHQDNRQQASLAFAAVSASSAHVQEILDEVERFVWSFPEAEVTASELTWMENG
jgi:uncharacterized protein YlxP (DUF503 family)